jgi:hypothetical protein
MVSCCEYGNEIGVYKMLGISEQLKNCQLLRNNPASCCMEIIVISFLGLRDTM